jgi:hypothetical protein
MLVTVLAAVSALASTVIPGTVQVAYPGTEDCAKGCNFVAAGWPFPYLVDHPVISPIGSVSLVQGLLGVDLIQPVPMTETFAFWLGLYALLAAVLGTLPRQHKISQRP